MCIRDSQLTGQDILSLFETRFIQTAYYPEYLTIEQRTATCPDGGIVLECESYIAAGNYVCGVTIRDNSKCIISGCNNLPTPYYMNLTCLIPKR